MQICKETSKFTARLIDKQASYSVVPLKLTSQDTLTGGLNDLKRWARSVGRGSFSIASALQGRRV